MKFHSSEFTVSTGKRMEVLDVTSNVNKIVSESEVSKGLVNVWVSHSTAAIAVNEHDTDLWEDILTAFERLVSIKGDYHHNAKYGWSAREQNAHAHILNCLIKPDVTIPLENGSLQLGTWQSVLFIEMDGPRTRRVRVQITGG